MKHSEKVVQKFVKLVLRQYENSGDKAQVVLDWKDFHVKIAFSQWYPKFFIEEMIESKTTSRVDHKLKRAFPCIYEIYIPEKFQQMGVFTAIVEGLLMEDGVRAVAVGPLINQGFKSHLLSCGWQKTFCVTELLGEQEVHNGVLYIAK